MHRRRAPVRSNPGGVADPLDDEVVVEVVNFSESMKDGGEIRRARWRSRTLFRWCRRREGEGRVAVDRIECDDRTVGTVDHRLLLTGGEVENVVGELETTGPDPVFLSVDIGELLEGDEVAAPKRFGRSGAVLEEGGRAVPPGGVASEAYVRAEHDGAVGDRRRVVAGTLVVVVSAFGTPAGEVHEETIARAI